MKRYTIKDLSEGRCAVENDGTLDELKEVLSKAFPNDASSSVIKGCHKFYYKSEISKSIWFFSDTTNLPTQSVKDFLVDDEKEYTRVKIGAVKECDLIFPDSALKCNEDSPRITRVWLEEDQEIEINFADGSKITIK